MISRSTSLASTPFAWLLKLGALFLMLAGAGCRSAPAGEPIALGTFYTQSSMRLEKGLYRSTNYRSDRTSTLLPINTQIELLSQRRNVVTARLVGGGEFRFEHIAKHTQDTLQEALDKVFGSEPVDLSQFSEEHRAAIEAGQAVVGMDRTAVLAAIGPPPASLTLSRELNEWAYSSTRWTNFVVRFGADGLVTSVGR